MMVHFQAAMTAPCKITGKAAQYLSIWRVEARTHRDKVPTSREGSRARLT